MFTNGDDVNAFAPAQLAKCIRPYKTKPTMAICILSTPLERCSLFVFGVCLVCVYRIEMEVKKRIIVDFPLFLRFFKQKSDLQAYGTEAPARTAPVPRG